MPAYREALAKLGNYRVTAKSVPVPLGGQRLDMDLLVGSLADGVALCLIKQDEFFDRPGVYGDERGEYQKENQDPGDFAGLGGYFDISHGAPIDLNL